MVGKEPTVKIGFTAPRDVAEQFRAAARQRNEGFSVFFRKVFEFWMRQGN